MKSFTWAIEDVLAAHPALYLEHCMVMAASVLSRQAQARNAASVLINCEGFEIPGLKGDQKLRVTVNWTEATAHKAERIERTEQPKPLLERATVALAALAFGKLIPHGEMRVTSEGDRADYWLPDLHCALEVSGTTIARELARRQREKARQVLNNPLGWNGYAFVACFAAPVAQVIWSYHVQEEVEHGT